MPYPEHLVEPMRQEAVAAGCEELRSAEDVEAAISKGGTSLFFINSVCGCAAGMARPGLAHALKTSDIKPDNAYTVFAGNDIDAVNAVRASFVGMPPSSPCMGLLKDGQLVSMVHRLDIEGHSAQQVSDKLKEIFQDNCQ